MTEHSAIYQAIAAINNRRKVSPAAMIPVSLQSGDQGLQCEEFIHFNISGQVFIVSPSLFQNIPLCKISNIKALEAHWSSKLQAFYFGRDPLLFNAVLNILRYNVLSTPAGYSKCLLREEAAFWEVPYTCLKLDDSEEEKLEKEFLQLENRMPPPQSSASKFAKFRYQAWCFITDPFGPHTHLRKLSLAYSVITILAVFTNLVMIGLGTRWDYRVSISPTVTREHQDSNFTTTDLRKPQTDLEDSMADRLGCFGLTKIDCYLITKQTELAHVTQLVVLSIFISETLLRLLLCPGLAYLKSVVNWLDIITSACAVAILITHVSLRAKILESSRSIGYLIEILNSLQVLRLFKIFQYANVVDGLMVMMLTIRDSIKELLLLVLYLLLAMFLFATALSLAELSADIGTGIPDTLHGYWWAIITMTTVGYGDYYPTTALGYIVGIICAITGIIMTALPVAVIGSHFTMYWEHNKKRNAARMEEIKRSSRK